MSRPTSVTCALEQCGNLVRFDNPTFPYCRFHYRLKKAHSAFSHPRSTAEMREFHEILTTVPTSSVSAVRQGYDQVARECGLHTRELAGIVDAWKKAGCHALPDSLAERAGELPRVMEEALPLVDAVCPGSTVVSCVNGLAKLPGVGAVAVNSHEVIVAPRDDGDVVIDLVPNAPLCASFSSGGELSRALGFERVAITEPLIVDRLAAYGWGGAIQWSELRDKNTGQMIWHTPTSNNDIDVQRQRELVAQYGVVSPPVTYIRDTLDMSAEEVVALKQRIRAAKEKNARESKEKSSDSYQFSVRSLIAKNRS